MINQKIIENEQEIIKKVGKFMKKFITIISVLILTFSGLFYLWSDVLSVKKLDLSQYYKIEVKGVSDEASAKIETLYNKKSDDEQINKFLENSNLTYSLSKDKNLKNNDVIEITAKYDKNLAKKYKIKPINTSIKYKVEKLPTFIKDIKEATDLIQTFISGQAQTNLNSPNVTQHIVRIYYKYDKKGYLEMKTVSVVYGSFVSYAQVHATIMYYVMDTNKLYKENNVVNALESNVYILDNMNYDMAFNGHDEMFKFINGKTVEIDKEMLKKGYKEFE